MKRIIEFEESSGLESLLGETVTLFCMNYIYTGRLSGVNESHVELSGAKIVYETGDFSECDWKDAQPLPHSPWRVQIAAIESWGILK